MRKKILVTESGLQRRIKLHLHAKKQEFFAQCAVGFEQFLKDELQVLPDVVIKGISPGGIEFVGPFELIYKTNLHLRTANRILLRIDTFSARSYPELYDKTSRIAWERYLGFNHQIFFDCSAKKSRLHHTTNIEKTVFKAMGNKMSLMDIPLKVDENSALRIFIRLFENRCTLSMDTTGEALYKRGYRRNIGEAPLRETTAATLLMACDFEKFPIIADPLCGSGTCIIEAVQMLCSIAPGMHRSFAFEAWPSFTGAAWNYLRKKSLAGVKTHCGKVLIAQDKDQKALNALKENAKRAGVDTYITIQRQNCLSFNSDGHLGNCGLVISNLPYGKRSGESDLVKNLYFDFGRQLKKSCKGWHFGFVIPAESIYYRELGLKSSSVIHFSNGGLPVQLIMGII